MEVSTRLFEKENEVTVHQVPARQGIPGNEKADECAKATAEGEVLIARYIWETNQPHMARIATESRSRTTA